jgi:hypothetical protein
MMFGFNSVAIKMGNDLSKLVAFRSYFKKPHKKVCLNPKDSQ